MDYTDVSALPGQLLADIWRQIVAHAPGLLAGVLTVAGGWVVALLLSRLTRRLIARLSRSSSGRAVQRELQDSKVERVVTEAVGRVVFWTVLLFAAALAGEMLGLSVITTGLSRLVLYLPSLLAAVLVVLAGAVLGNLARRAIVSGAVTAGIGHGELVAGIARVAIWVVAGVVALDQIGIESTLLILTVAILVGTAVGSAALAFALGARDAVSGSIALHYLGQSYRVGDAVRLGDLRGKIVEFTRTAIVLDTSEGRALVPATEFGGRTSVLLKETS